MKNKYFLLPIIGATACLLSSPASAICGNGQLQEQEKEAVRKFVGQQGDAWGEEHDLDTQRNLIAVGTDLCSFNPDVSEYQVLAAITHFLEQEAPVVAVAAARAPMPERDDAVDPATLALLQQMQLDDDAERAAQVFANEAEVQRLQAEDDARDAQIAADIAMAEGLAQEDQDHFQAQVVANPVPAMQNEDEMIADALQNHPLPVIADAAFAAENLDDTAAIQALAQYVSLPQYQANGDILQGDMHRLIADSYANFRNEVQTRLLGGRTAEYFAGTIDLAAGYPRLQAFYQGRLDAVAPHIDRELCRTHPIIKVQQALQVQGAPQVPSKALIHHLLDEMGMIR